MIDWNWILKRFFLNLSKNNAAKPTIFVIQRKDFVLKMTTIGFAVTISAAFAILCPHAAVVTAKFFTDAILSDGALSTEAILKLQVSLQTDCNWYLPYVLLHTVNPRVSLFYSNLKVVCAYNHFNSKVSFCSPPDVRSQMEKRCNSHCTSQNGWIISILWTWHWRHQGNDVYAKEMWQKNVHIPFNF